MLEILNCFKFIIYFHNDHFMLLNIFHKASSGFWLLCTHKQHMVWSNVIIKEILICDFRSSDFSKLLNISSIRFTNQ